MNVAWYRTRNWFRKAATRLRYPPPVYKKVGSIGVTVNRANGRTENLKNVSHTYAKRWGVSTGGGGPTPEQATELRRSAEEFRG